MSDIAERWAGALIKDARLQGGWSQVDLAAAAGVPQSVISEYENARRQPSAARLLRILAAAGYDLRAQLTPRDTTDDTLDAWLATQPDLAAAFAREQARRPRPPRTRVSSRRSRSTP